ncbi:MerR family transcriptional regulator [uncultured Thiothrix sp.]|uniref:MerR family transcriptional regulator n=1 Tax=uncultured Thiothrix sp. TaxID=223185 RepID=UPI002627EEAA|nr:MerR family transcriptional regulator [uncultured Thiothrix sp.]
MQEAQIPNSELPPIPSKRYFTIGEVSDLCCVKAYILRYWEQEFPSLKPMKRRGNRRYYQREDVLMIRQIRGLLYEEGYTISGARQKLLGSSDEPLAPPTEESPTDVLEQVILSLENVLVTLKS